MPLGLGAHAERDGEQHGENHNKTNLQRALSGDKVQDGGRAHQQSDSGEDEDKADDDIDAAFTVQVQMIVVASLALL